MRPIHRYLTLIAPKLLDSGRGFIPSVNVILLVAFTPFLSCASAAFAQAIQAPEQCNYATDQDLRPATSNASAEAAAAANTYTAPEASAAEGLRLPELKSDGSSAGQQNVECKPEDKTAPSAAPKAAIPAAAPAPPPPPPLAAYSNGMLTIRAHDARFGDVLDAIKTSTGVAVQYPPSLANDRVFDELGPAPMREVLTAFLEGSRFNYVIVGSSNPQIVKGLILTARTGSSTAMATNLATPAVMKEPGAYGAAPADYNQQDEPQAQPIPVPAARVNPLPASVGKSLQEEAAALQAANPQMTHGEILAEMQKRNDERLDQEAAQSEAQQPPPQQ